MKPPLLSGRVEVLTTYLDVHLHALDEMLHLVHSHGADSSPLLRCLGDVVSVLQGQNVLELGLHEWLIELEEHCVTSECVLTNVGLNLGI
jgi:hypothetical protein